MLDVAEIRKHFPAFQGKRVITNNAASTQVPQELIRLLADLTPEYENVHRGQSKPSLKMSSLLEDPYDTISAFLHSGFGKETISLYRNTTEAINSVMYSLLTEFNDGDNVVITRMEHNSNFVPWYGMCKEILPKFGRKVEYRLVGFDSSGQLDMSMLRKKVDNRTKLVCCTGASNFLGTKPDLMEIRRITWDSRYYQPGGTQGSYLLVDGAQLVPSAGFNVTEIPVDFLAFSLHKMTAPFGVGVLYTTWHLQHILRPFLYGGDMVAQSGVYPDHVKYNDLPWKFSAGTPNILGNIVSAQSIRLLLDLAMSASKNYYFRSKREIPAATVKRTMQEIREYTTDLTGYCLDKIVSIPKIEVYGPLVAEKRSPLVAFNINGWSPVEIAEALAKDNIEARAGCHCATLAHRYLILDPPASCRLSFYLYNNTEDIDAAIDSLKKIAVRRKVISVRNPCPCARRH